jgi:hypothetical protein
MEEQEISKNVKANEKCDGNPSIKLNDIFAG